MERARESPIASTSKQKHKLQFERYSHLKAKDPKGAESYKTEMTTRFRKTVAALEDENREQRRQLEELHDERVTSALNERKRKVCLQPSARFYTRQRARSQ